MIKTSSPQSNMEQKHVQEKMEVECQTYIFRTSVRWLHETHWVENTIVLQAKKEVDEELGPTKLALTLDERWDLICVKCRERAMEPPNAQTLKRWHVRFQEGFSSVRQYQDTHPWSQNRDYWMLTDAEKVEFCLPPSFDRDLYELMNVYLDNDNGLGPLCEASGSGLVPSAA